MNGQLLLKRLVGIKERRAGEQTASSQRSAGIGGEMRVQVWSGSEMEEELKGGGSGSLFSKVGRDWRRDEGAGLISPLLHKNPVGLGDGGSTEIRPGSEMEAAQNSARIGEEI